MGAAATTCTYENSAIEPINSIQSHFPKDGVRLSVFCDFTESVGREVLSGLTTYDVYSSHILPLLSTEKITFCNFWARKNPLDIGSATVIVLHPWSLLFLDVVDTITDHFKNSMNTFVWWDVFSCNSVDSGTIDRRKILQTHKQVINEVGHIGVILTPMTTFPTFFSRTWCLWEAYCASVSSVKFEVILNYSERQKILMDVIQDVDNVSAKISDIDIERSEASSQEDKNMILSMIQDTVGIESFNTVIIQLFRTWLLDFLETELVRSVESEDDKLQLQLAIGRLQLQREKYKVAQSILMDVFTARRAAHPDLQDARTLDSMHYLAEAYGFQGEVDEVVRISSVCLARKRAFLGDDDPSTLKSMTLVAQALATKRKFREAESLYAECLSRETVVLGETHVDTLRTINNLATAYSVQGKYDSAEELYSRCMEHQKLKLGDSHFDTLLTMGNLAGVYTHQQKLDEAAALYRDVLSKQSLRLGEAHPATFITRTHLITVYNKLGKFDEANALQL